MLFFLGGLAGGASLKTKNFKWIIMEIAKKENLFVLEDAAQGFGGIYMDRKAGGLGHAGATSFFPAKPLGCYGD